MVRGARRASRRRRCRLLSAAVRSSARLGLSPPARLVGGARQAVDSTASGRRATRGSRGANGAGCGVASKRMTTMSQQEQREASRRRHEELTQLQVTHSLRAYQREWFARLRKDVFEPGRPYAIGGALVPHEIFEALDLPFITDVWYSGLVAARRQSAYYSNYLVSQGYHEGLSRYGALALAVLLDEDNPDKPWGGLSKPALVVTGAGDRAADVLARVSGAVRVPLELPVAEPALSQLVGDVALAVGGPRRHRPHRRHGGAAPRPDLGRGVDRRQAHGLRPPARDRRSCQPAGGVLRRGAHHHRHGGQAAGAARRGDEPDDGHPVAPRHRVGAWLRRARSATR